MAIHRDRDFRRHQAERDAIRRGDKISRKTLASKGHDGNHRHMLNQARLSETDAALFQNKWEA